MSKKAKWGYLAAMIDGEGFITIGKGSAPAPNGNGYMTDAPRYNLIVSVTGTSIPLMKWLVSNFGGSWSRDKKRIKASWKRRAAWRVNGMKNKEIVLLGILPYLVIKAEQAKIGLEFIRMHGQQNPSRREALRQQMLALNKRGVIVTTNTPDFSGEDDAPDKKATVRRWNPYDLDPVLEKMIEPDLDRNTESALPVTAAA